MQEELFSKKILAGSRRTYFIDVKKTEKGEVFIQFSEAYQNSRGGTDRSRINIYKEDFQKVEDGLLSAMNFIKNDLNIKFY